MWHLHLCEDIVNQKKFDAVELSMMNLSFIPMQNILFEDRAFFGNWISADELLRAQMTTAVK